MYRVATRSAVNEVPVVGQRGGEGGGAFTSLADAGTCAARGQCELFVGESTWSDATDVEVQLGKV